MTIARRGFGDLSLTFLSLRRVQTTSQTRIQLCGRLAVEMDAEHIEGRLPGPKGRALFTYLVLHRHRPINRDDLLMATYGQDAFPGQHSGLTVLLSKLRSVIGHDRLMGRSEIELRLPADAFVDVEAAREALHRAESHIAAGQWAEAWGPAGVAYHISGRPLLQDQDHLWLDDWRRRLQDVHLRGLESFAQARLGLGGPTLPQAEDCARRLIELAPYRETGHRILIETLERRGNLAEALRAFHYVRRLLNQELGVDPSPHLQQIHQRLLQETTTRA